MNKNFAAIARDWALETLRLHCDEQGFGHTEDDVAYDLVQHMAELHEDNFIRYIEEERGGHLDDCLMPGIADFLKDKGYDLASIWAEDCDVPEGVVILTKEWFSHCFGTFGLCYNFDTAYYELADNE